MTYPGGKGGAGVYQTIINQIPPHIRYIEPFLGESAIMRYKRPADSSIGVDADISVIARWRSGEWPIPHLTTVCGDGVHFIKESMLGAGDFVYCDPPYLFETRNSQRQLYLYEMGLIDEHTRLLDVLLGLPCMVAISGYYSDLYAEKLAGWRSITFQTITRGGTLATEWLWMNYPPPMRLHDYRYLGDDFRERERIKRKKTRWRSRLEKLDDLERYALLETIQELWER